MVEEFFQKIFSEYGAFVSFLLLVIGGLIKVVQTLWAKLEVLLGKIEDLSKRFLETVENNTKVMTRLTEKLESKDE